MIYGIIFIFMVSLFKSDFSKITHGGIILLDLMCKASQHCPGYTVRFWEDDLSQTSSITCLWVTVIFPLENQII